MLRRVSSGTMHNFGAYETNNQRLNRILKKRSTQSKRKLKKINSLPISIERRMPGATDYDGFTMKRRKGGRKTRRRKTRRKKRC